MNGRRSVQSLSKRQMVAPERCKRKNPAQPLLGLHRTWPRTPRSPEEAVEISPEARSLDRCSVLVARGSSLRARARDGRAGLSSRLWRSSVRDGQNRVPKALLPQDGRLLCLHRADAQGAHALPRARGLAVHARRIARRGGRDAPAERDALQRGGVGVHAVRALCAQQGPLLRQRRLLDARRAQAHHRELQRHVYALVGLLLQL